MIVVTGAAGFIGSNIVSKLNEVGREDIVAVDLFSSSDAKHLLPNDPGYLDEMKLADRVEKDELFGWLERSGKDVETIIHMGACSDTTQTDRDFMMDNNLHYTQRLWRWCTQAGRCFVYASSAATYGDGSSGYDDQADPAGYKPLNLYGETKQLFDLWALGQGRTPPRWVGLKYFNVYGPRESHKGRMASVAFHAFNQIRDAGQVRLFKSHKEGIPDGGQERDFIFVDDAVEVTLKLAGMHADAQSPNGLYNVGTGEARSFEDLARAVFAALSLPVNIVYIPMPEDLRDRYQYFTRATTARLRTAGFKREFHSLEGGVRKYVEYLLAREER